ncbi:MAG: NAD(P)H-hydrate dehydratase, partial [Rhizobiales bacterium]|nr:NAD(P)H-hydrate dehydratase [Hyphomicrobiales bacterium]
GLWRAMLPRPALDTHKYARGHVAVFSGGATATGAARLSAMAAARIGAGAVTVLAPPDALAANAAHLTSIMLQEAVDIEAAAAFANERRVASIVYGPGLSPDAETGSGLFRLIDALNHSTPVVADASALTSLGLRPDLLAPPFAGRAGELVLTPHEGEFRRLFPDISDRAVPSKLERARQAAARTEAVVVYKGPDTVIAAPDGRAAINGNGTPLLATAGSGDVLAGLTAGLLAQRMQAFEAACAAVWIHAEAAAHFGAGLIAEDLPLAILPVMKELLTDER